MSASRLISLIRTQIDVTFSLSHSYFYYIKKRQRIWELVLALGSILSLAGMLSTGVYWLGSSVYQSAVKTGQGGLTVVIGLLATQFLIMLLGFVLVIGVFYYSRDLTILIPLPVRPWEVVAGKFSVVMASELLVQLVVTLPLLVAYSVHAPVSYAWFWLHLVPVFLLLPAIPLVFGAVPAILFMRLARSAGRRDLFIVIGGFVLVFGILGVQFFLTDALPQRSDMRTIQALLRQADGLVNVLGAVFPPSLWAAKALTLSGTWEGATNLLRFVTASLLAVLLLLAVGEKVFYRGVIDGFETPNTRRRGLSSRPAMRFTSQGAVLALAWTEVRLFVRTPVFVLNGFLGFVLLPALMLLGRSDDDLKVIFTIGKGSPEAAALLIAGYLTILVSMSTIPFSPFSREGAGNIWIPKSLPTSGRTIAMAKVYASLMMVWPGSIPGIVILTWMLSLPFPYALVGVGIGMATSAAFAVSGVLVDMFHPMLHWTSPARAIKSNTNTLVSLAAGAGVSLGSGFLVKRLFEAGWPGWIVLATMAALMLLMLSACWLLLRRLANRLWERLEV